MERRQLGHRGPSVSVIGYGAFKIGRNQKIKYPSGYALPTFEEAQRLLNGVLDMGINLIDTAPAYGHSEAWIGEAIGHRRDEFVLSTKVGEIFEDGASRWDYSAAGVASSIERSLKRLRTDHVDLLYIHSNGDDRYVLNETDAVRGVLDAKRRGLARWVGLSGYSTEGVFAALEWSDAVFVEYHIDDTQLESAIADAGSRGCGVAVKKPLAAGRLPPREALSFVLANPVVATAVIGSLNLAHLRENVAVISDLQNRN